MKNLSFLFTFIVLGMAVFLGINASTVSSKPTPESSGGGWFAAGSNPKDYKMEITTAVKHSGTHAAMIQYTSTDKPSGFGTYMQMHKPGAWLGKEVKMTGWIKSENVEDWSGMWCRVDGADRKEMLDFDNMEDRPIKGTTDWKKYEITVNIPKDASAIAYGVLVSGKGTVYFDDITFEVLGDAKPPKKKGRDLPDNPANLNFEN
jgi:hypothetical protein